jgi:cyanate permease
VADIASPGSVGLTLAFAMVANQVAIVTIPPLIGLVMDATGSYAPAWWALAGGLLLATLVVARSATRSPGLNVRPEERHRIDEQRRK